MRLTRYLHEGVPEGGIWWQDRVVGIYEINARLGTEFPTDSDTLIQAEGLPSLAQVIQESTGVLAELGFAPDESTRFLSVITRPPKIWCIGLNYSDHANQLGATSPDVAPSFMRPAFSLIGPGDDIVLPAASSRVTGEAELGIVVGKTVRDVSEDEAMDCIAGFVPALDMTAEDIQSQSPLLLTRSKCFDTFLSLGATLVTPDEIGSGDALAALRTATVLNGEQRHDDVVGNMRHSPASLIASHSQGMTWRAGDLLLTGTPGAVPLTEGDRLSAEIDGVGGVSNPVRSA